MKRCFCWILAAILTVSLLMLCSCSTSGETEPTAAKPTLNSLSNVEKFVREGKIDTAEFPLGTPADEIIKKYSPDENSEKQESTLGSDVVFNITEKAAYTRIVLGTNQYFYLNNDPQKRISVLSSSTDAFNFKIGNCPSDSVIQSLGKPSAQDIPGVEDQIYSFVPIVENITRLTYNVDHYRLDFIFIEDNLQNIVLTDTSLYKNMGHTGKVADSTAAQTASSTAAN